MIRLRPRLIASVFALAASSSLVLAQGPGGVTRFCQTGAQRARIFAGGSSDFQVNGGSGDLVLRAVGIPASTVGLFFYGGQEQAPAAAGNGFLCIGAGAGPFRMDPVATGPTETSVTSPVDYLQPPTAAGEILPGSAWNFQFWFRDSTGFDLTDAIRIEFGPPEAITQSTVVAEAFRSRHPLAQTFEGGVVVMNTAAELRLNWALHTEGVTPAPPLPQVDMDEVTVIAAFAGRRLTSGYTMSITGVDVSIATLDVATDERRPGSGCGTFASETQPMQFIAVRKIDGARLGEWTPAVTTYTCP
ncbi:MAG: protease complex subunit PrcB family protein [Planctomycetota bacterium]